jgi:hypothetical protein
MSPTLRTTKRLRCARKDGRAEILDRRGSAIAALRAAILPDQFAFMKRFTLSDRLEE